MATSEEKNKSSLYLPMVSIKSAIFVLDGHFHYRWVFCPLKNICDKRYTSDYSFGLGIISHSWCKFKVIAESCKTFLR